MSTPSNLYAEKIFAEHPDNLWALDEDVHYYSRLSENSRKIENWDILIDGQPITTGILDHAFETSLDYNAPFLGSALNQLVGAVPEGLNGTIKCISEDIVNFQDFSSSMSTFSIGTYFYSISQFIKSVEIGYQYYSTLTGNLVENLKTYDFPYVEKWGFFSITSDIVPENTTIRLVFKINYITGGATDSDYSFLLNGFSLGQWSEEFNATSLGSYSDGSLSDIAISDTEGIKAYSYGKNSDYGYYLIDDNSLLAKNSGVPMVYGAGNTTILYSNSNNIDNTKQPSLIIPGRGFLNNSGKYKEQTMEMWIRVNSDSVNEKRFFGPISSDDGLYVDGPFLKLKIGDNIGSHFIGEWTRPMLVHIRILNNSASVLINGEEVILMSYITENLVFPDELSEYGKEQDWLGFYAYEDVSPIELDCIAFYSYQVPTVVAKKRFAYGQAVEFPENLSITYNGSSIYVDYPFAKYANNYSYPDFGRWNQGISDNLVIDTSSISTPEYDLPEIALSMFSEEQLLEDCKSIQSGEYPFISLRPNESWSAVEGYILFEDLGLIKQDIKSMYGCFKINPSTIANKEQLFFIESKSNPLNHLSIYTQNEQVFYKLKYGEVIYDLRVEDISTEDDFFIAGLNFDIVSKSFNSDVNNFLSNKNDLRLYVGGNKSLTNTFSGNIYRISFSGYRNFEKIKNHFSEDGFITLNSFPVINIFDTVFTHLGSYTLLPYSKFGQFGLDVGVNGYWEDYLPLQQFAKYVTDAKGNAYYDLDFLQFNINYPSPSKFTRNEEQASWTYAELKQSFAYPEERTYSDLDNSLFTGYESYLDLQNKSISYYDYDTTDSCVRSYISFQYVKNGANAPESYFIYQDRPNKDGVVNPGANWKTTRYEIVDNMIIYPPASVSFSDLAIVIHLDFNLLSTKYDKVNIKKLQLASQSLNNDKPNPIGTRFGKDMFPYKKTGYYYTYKEKNPFVIYKGSSPYLYLTKNSGITVKGNIDPRVDRGIAIPINDTVSANYKMIAMQMALRFDQDFFPYSPTPIFTINAKDYDLNFYIEAIDPSGKRAKIFCVDSRTGLLQDGIGYYWNGRLVRDPVITVKEWGFFGLGFANSLDFSKMQGSINLHAPLTFNTISYYLANDLQETQKITTRPWIRLKGVFPDEFEWADWISTMWRGVLILATVDSYGLSPDTVYKNYTGTNKIIVDSGKKITLNKYEYNVYKDILWQQTTNNAV
jgi:hypothetical protein